MDLLTKFEQVEMKADTRISELTGYSAWQIRQLMTAPETP